MMLVPYAVLLGLYGITVAYAIRRMWRFHTEGDATLFMSWTFGIVSALMALASLILLVAFGNFGHPFKV